MRGGIAQFIAILYDRLKQRGIESRIISFKKQFPKYFFPGKTQVEYSKDIIPVQAFPILVPYYPHTWLRAFNEIRKGKPDLVIFKWWVPFFAPCFGTILILMRKFSGSRSLFIVDNAIPHEKYPLGLKLTKWVFKKVDTFIVMSEAVKRDLYTVYPDCDEKKIKKVMHPVYDTYRRKNIDKKEARERLKVAEWKNVLLYFGFIKPYKGVMNLIRAMEHVVRALPETVLLLVGEFYDDSRQYYEAIERLGLKKHIIVVDRYVANEEVEDYFSAADAVVLPYVSATQSGIVQIAYSFALPVISTRVGGIPEVVKHGITGLLVKPGSPEALSGEIIRFYGQELENIIRQGILTTRDKYSWEPFLKVIEES
jgi:glycosyltransferase involved in cell wall biosynthesis